VSQLPLSIPARQPDSILDCGDNQRAAPFFSRSAPPENSAFPASPREKRPVNAQSGYLLNPLWFMNSQMRPIQV
jgi:hypothetical protein